MKCSTIGCRNQVTRLMSWRDPYAERSSAEHPSDAYYPELDRESDRVTDAVCDDCLTSYQHRPALQARDEGPVEDSGATARRLIGERE